MSLDVVLEVSFDCGFVQVVLSECGIPVAHHSTTALDSSETPGSLPDLVKNFAQPKNPDSVKK